MPVNPLVPDTVEVRVHFSRTDGEMMVNTFYVDRGGSPLSSGDASTIEGDFLTVWTAHLLPLMSSSVTLYRITVTDLDVANGPQFMYSPLVAGSLTDNPIPNQVAAVTTWRTATRGRSFRGRTYLGGFTEAHSVGGSPTTTLLTAVDAWAGQLFGDLATDGFPLQVVSRYHLNPTPPPVTIPRVTNVVTPITGYSVDLAWKTQRRRALKG